MELIDIKKAAQVLNLGVSTLRNWVQARRVPFIRLGRRIVFDMEALKDFVDKRRVPERQPRGIES